ncbi:MAG: SURF1 family protein [Burkholderiaceae bacterium]|nr:SURF1 family protein [Burkholderiaceae bacterium]
MTREGLRRAVVLLAALVAVALTARLGVWQLDRAAQKTALQRTIDERAVLPPLPADALATSADAATAQHHRRIALRGTWVREHTVYLENRQMDQRPGFFAVTPLRLPDGSAVLVQRGWLPRDAQDRTRLAPVRDDGGELELVGRIAPPPARLYEFDPAAGGRIRQNLELESFARETGLALRPLSILQLDSPAFEGDGLRRQWSLPAVDVHKHYGYAFQWFALATLITGLYVWFQLVQPRRRR